MKIKNSLLIIAITGVLIGCGSGSSSGSNNGQGLNGGSHGTHNPDNTNGNTNPEPTKPEASTKVVSHLINNGHLYGNLVSTAEQLDTMKKVEYNDINSIIVDGKRIDIDDEAKITRLPNQKFYENTLAGFYADNGKEFFFSGGTLTPKSAIPSGGGVRYEGTFLGKTSIDGKVIKELQEGADVYLDVDFDKNFITGYVDSEEIEANILGNTFKGDKKTHWTIPTGNGELDMKSIAHIEGAFYGSEYDEASGSFSYEKEMKGSGTNTKTKKFGIFQTTKH